MTASARPVRVICLLANWFRDMILPSRSQLIRDSSLTKTEPAGDRHVSRGSAPKGWLARHMVPIRLPDLTYACLPKLPSKGIT